MKKSKILLLAYIAVMLVLAFAMSSCATNKSTCSKRTGKTPDSYKWGGATASKGTLRCASW